jgi:hypothetical protein
MGVFADRRSTWVVGIVVLFLLFLGLSQCTGSTGTTRVGAVPNSQGPAEPAPAPTDTGGSSDTRGSSDNNNDQGDDDPDRNDSGSGTLTVDGEPLLPLAVADGVGSDGDLTALSGKRAVARRTQVLTVPADEGFWVGTGDDDRVWVQLTGLPPESPYTVRAGDTVDFTARVRPNGRGFARAVGVDDDEGAATLTAQRQHIDVPKRALSLHPA